MMMNVGNLKSVMAKLPPVAQKPFMVILGDLRLALSDSITSIYHIAAFIMIAGVLLMFFMKEIALRKTHNERPAVQEAGAEMLVEQAVLMPEDEPAFD